MKKPAQENTRTPFHHSSLYQEFLEERDEILRLKWIESEKAGEDIGFEKALLTWVRNHRHDWKACRCKEEVAL